MSDERFQARKAMLREEARRLMAHIDTEGWMDTNEVLFCCAYLTAECLRMAEPDQVTQALMEFDQWVLEELRRA